MNGFSAFTKKQDANGGPTDKQIQDIKAKYKQLIKLGATSEIVKDPIFQEFNMYISPDGNEIEVDNKTI
jgi:hypothetical protein